MRRESGLLRPGQGAMLPLALLPPTSKLATAFVFTVFTSFLSKPGTAAIACFFPFILAVTGGVPLKDIGQRLLPVNFFFIFLWLFLPLTVSSGEISIASSRFFLAALITLKGNAIAAMLIILLGTSTIGESCRGLLRLGVPEKLVTLLLLTHANLGHMASEYKAMYCAARLRGFVPKKTFSACKTLAYLAAMLLIRSWQRAMRVSDAMRLRGFSGQYPLLDLPRPAPYLQYGPLFFTGISLGAGSILLADILL